MELVGNKRVKSHLAKFILNVTENKHMTIIYYIITYYIYIYISYKSHLMTMIYAIHRNTVVSHCLKYYT